MTNKLLIAFVAATMSAACFSGSLYEDFMAPSDDAKPYCYWWWINGHVDKKTITADLEAMKRLGFGGLLMFDSRGYWDDERHVVNPKPEIAFMSEEWQDYVVFAIKEASRLGLKFTMNMSSSGGKLDGPWEVGEDAPKRLVYKFYKPGSAFEKPEGLAYYHDIAAQEVWYAGDEIALDGEWHDGGEGEVARSDSSKARYSSIGGKAGRALVDKATPGAHCVLVRFGYATLPEHEHDVDVLDAKAVAGHFERFQGELQKRLPGLVGRDKTLSALYSVSWEGSMPTWTGDFPAQFRKFTGLDVMPYLPYLAGFTSQASQTSFLTAYRRARNDMFRENFYGTMRDLAHERNLDWYSESGGPWNRDPKLFGEADQLQFLSVNDFPQGEFWPVAEHLTTADDGLENKNGRFHVRGAVNAAHIYGRRIAAAESFTHMHRHWSVDPAFLKPLADQVFADGVNRIVWHTFTCSPEKFGVPGAEYFAGSHINRNVTWHEDLKAMIGYLGRCQALLQMGEPVTDIAILGGNRTYSHWGRFRTDVADAKKEPHLNVKIPHGFAYDLVNDDALAKNPSLTNRYQIVYDLRKGGDALATKGSRKGGDALATGKILPDCQPINKSITWCHRRIEGVADIYFLTGEGDLNSLNGWVTFRATAPFVEMWDPLTGERTIPQHKRGKSTTGLQLGRKHGGSVFILFLQQPSIGPDGSKAEPFDNQQHGRITFPNAEWRVTFAYPKGISAKPPAPLKTTKLDDFTAMAKRPDLKAFSGTATYRTSFRMEQMPNRGRIMLSLGALPTGLAHVYLNGRDCGVAWCRPWEVEVSKALRVGDNELEIRYTNNWFNRLLADCSLPPEKRVTTSTLRYWNVPRKGTGWRCDPTIYSGFSSYDTPQSSGLIGPVELHFSSKAMPKVNPCGLGSSALANWITLGETIAFTNSLPADAEMEGVVTDTSNREVFRGKATGNVWKWRPTRTGFYTVNFTAIQGGERKPVIANLLVRYPFYANFPRDTFAIAVSPKAPRKPGETPRRFGFNVSANEAPRHHAESRDLVALLGMNAYLRLHYFRWNEMEQKQGEIDWSVPDEALKFWRENGYDYDRLLVNVFGTPTWLSTAPKESKMSKVWYERPALYPPREMGPVREFFRKFAERYHGLRHFEVWNEPHLPGFSVFWKNGSPEQFVELLKHAYLGIKDADKSIEVVMGGIGMRYLPFYERVVPLGITKWYDSMDTHCGYDMRPFKEVERRFGYENKPYWEGEWHTVLYNCSDPNPPSEEECAFRMLQNFADLLTTDTKAITGFGLKCGAHTPETAKAFARQGGIQQVCGLFRSEPFVEPRFAAFALRTATDLFAGDVKNVGAWRFGDDGRWYAVVQQSDLGKVAFVWTAKLGTSRGAVPPALCAAGQGRRVLDWEGHEVGFDAMLPRRMYYILAPDMDAIRKGVQTEDAVYITYNFKGYQSDKLARGGYGAAAKPMDLGKGASFAADLDGDGLRLDITLPKDEKMTSIGVVADAEGHGLLEDVLEFRITPDGTIVKPRTPALKGDIPTDYSPANVPLANSRATPVDGHWKISLSRGDMYPFAYSPGKRLALSLKVTTDRMMRAWGGGWAKLIEPDKFGQLVPSGGCRRCDGAPRPFGQAEFSCKDGVVSVRSKTADAGAGVSLPIASYVPGSVIRYSGEVRGKFGRLQVGCWCSLGRGKSERRNGDGVGDNCDDWKPFTGTIEVLPHSQAGELNIFSWREPDADWQIRNLKIINE